MGSDQVVYSIAALVLQLLNLHRQVSNAQGAQYAKTSSPEKERKEREGERKGERERERERERDASPLVQSRLHNVEAQIWLSGIIIERLNGLERKLRSSKQREEEHYAHLSHRPQVLDMWIRTSESQSLVAPPPGVEWAERSRSPLTLHFHSN